MASGWLVVNQYVINSEKFMELFQMLLEAANKYQCDLSMITNEEMWEFHIKGQLEEEICSRNFVLFWDKDIYLATLCEHYGIRVFNSAHAIETCDDKGLTYLALLDKNIEMPKTIIGPKIFSEYGFEKYDFFEKIQQEWTFPIIIKECHGSFGKQVYLANTMEEVILLLRKIGNRPFLLQEYISSSKGRDIRIQVVGGEVTASMLRTNPNDFRANISNGGSMSAYNPTIEQKNMALAVCRELKLDFAGVDILFGEDERPIFCEVNSNAHFKNLYDCTNINAGEDIIRYIQKEVSLAGITPSNISQNNVSPSNVSPSNVSQNKDGKL